MAACALVLFELYGGKNFPNASGVLFEAVRRPPDKKLNIDFSRQMRRVKFHQSGLAILRGGVFVFHPVQATKGHRMFGDLALLDLDAIARQDRKAVALNRCHAVGFHGVNGKESGVVGCGHIHPTVRVIRTPSVRHRNIKFGISVRHSKNTRLCRSGSQDSNRKDRKAIACQNRPQSKIVPTV
jgi:hypothetical protein